MPALNYNISYEGLTNIKIVGSFDEKYQLKLIVNSDNKTLLNLLNKAISTITEKERELISSKYYSVIFQNSYDYKEIYKVVVPLIIVIFFIIRSNRKMNMEIKKRTKIEKELQQMANIDPLTQIFNRRKIKSMINQEIHRFKRYKRDFSIIFFDIDDFKFVNDNLGHSIGDEVLVKISNVVKSSIRDADYFGRWGGEEFIIILPETDKIKASNIAHILKEKISNNDFSVNKTITCSFGVTQFEESDNEDSILSRVDHAMYYVKKHGKNSVKVA
ncbi:diguanylate cyclase [Halarcobacter ebronensis]